MLRSCCHKSWTNERRQRYLLKVESYTRIVVLTKLRFYPELSDGRTTILIKRHIPKCFCRQALTGSFIDIDFAFDMRMCRLLLIFRRLQSIDRLQADGGSPMFRFLLFIRLSLPNIFVKIHIAVFHNRTINHLYSKKIAALG